jgi:tRNA(Arg) A34 adenosine deaminase TadA
MTNGWPSDQIFAEAWIDLEAPFQTALEQAWSSCAAGTVGVGATITDPNGTTIAIGRNRVYDELGGNGLLQRTLIAHAEMNAFAAISTDVDLSKSTLWTSQHPCVLCASAAIITGVGTVRFLAADPFFTGVERLPTLNDWFAERWPKFEGPTNDDRWAIVAMILQLNAAASRNPGGPVMQANRKVEPEATDLIEEIVRQESWTRAAQEQQPIGGALEPIWRYIVAAAIKRSSRRFGVSEN